MGAALVFAIGGGLLTSCTVSATSDDVSKQEAALRHARANIEKHRKGDAKVRVLGRDGKPSVGAQVRIKQVSHAFRFGCYLKIDDLAPEKLAEYENHFGRLFNYAVVGNYWRVVEKEQGSKSWKWFEREIALSRKLGVRIQSAPLLWGTNRAGRPAWLPRRREEMIAALDDRIRSSISMGLDTVDDWEVVNEPLAPNRDIFSDVAGSGYIDRAFRLAREAAPSKRLMINESGVFGSTAGRSRNRQRYYDLAEKLIKDAVPVDIIGIQAHSVGDWYRPADIAEQLQRFARLGKPLQITEFSVQTHEFDDDSVPLPIAGGYKSGTWTDAKQAEIYREFYTIAFGTPEVEGITTWGLDDNRAWLPGIGLIGKNEEAKPAYKVLDSLINLEWHTDFTGTADERGELNFRGFYGGYVIEVISDPKRPLTKALLDESGSNEWIVRAGV